MQACIASLTQAVSVIKRQSQLKTGENIQEDTFSFYFILFSWGGWHFFSVRENGKKADPSLKCLAYLNEKQNTED